MQKERFDLKIKEDSIRKRRLRGLTGGHECRMV